MPSVRGARQSNPSSTSSLHSSASSLFAQEDTPPRTESDRFFLKPAGNESLGSLESLGFGDLGLTDDLQQAVAAVGSVAAITPSTAATASNSGANSNLNVTETLVGSQSAWRGLSGNLQRLPGGDGRNKLVDPSAEGNQVPANAFKMYRQGDCNLSNRADNDSLFDVLQDPFRENDDPMLLAVSPATVNFRNSTSSPPPSTSAPPRLGDSMSVSLPTTPSTVPPGATDLSAPYPAFINNTSPAHGNLGEVTQSDLNTASQAVPIAPWVHLYASNPELLTGQQGLQDAGAFPVDPAAAFFPDDPTTASDALQAATAASWSRMSLAQRLQLLAVARAMQQQPPTPSPAAAFPNAPSVRPGPIPSVRVVGDPGGGTREPPARLGTASTSALYVPSEYDGSSSLLANTERLLSHSSELQQQQGRQDSKITGSGLTLAGGFRAQSAAAVVAGLPTAQQQQLQQAGNAQSVPKDTSPVNTPQSGGTNEARDPSPAGNAAVTPPSPSSLTQPRIKQVPAPGTLDAAAGFVSPDAAAAESLLRPEVSAIDLIREDTRQSPPGKQDQPAPSTIPTPLIVSTTPPGRPPPASTSLRHPPPTPGPTYTHPIYQPGHMFHPYQYQPAPPNSGDYGADRRSAKLRRSSGASVTSSTSSTAQSSVAKTETSTSPVEPSAMAMAGLARPPGFGYYGTVSAYPSEAPGGGFYAAPIGGSAAPPPSPVPRPPLPPTYQQPQPFASSWPGYAAAYPGYRPPPHRPHFGAPPPMHPGAAPVTGYPGPPPPSGFHQTPSRRPASQPAAATTHARTTSASSVSSVAGRPAAAVAGHAADGSSAEDGGEHEDGSEAAMLKRRRNTEAARRSRQKKMLKVSVSFEIHQPVQATDLLFTHPPPSSSFPHFQTTQLADLENFVKRLEAQNSKLTVKVAVLENEKETLQSRQRELIGRISNMETQLREAHQSLLVLNAAVAAPTSGMPGQLGTEGGAPPWKDGTAGPPAPPPQTSLAQELAIAVASRGPDPPAVVGTPWGTEAGGEEGVPTSGVGIGFYGAAQGYMPRPGGSGGGQDGWC
ncbi:hypothetical protein HDU96_009247 [Phlyctochytrium bullatum]|nr:hypothetical protein HDU96_009247 [Phlyctochytrium bullatum]